MKELSIEEKAQRYDEALERARYWEKNPTVWSSDDICQKLFPELKESEDERIIKALISILKSYFEKNTIIYGISVGDIIAWLEKQGEQKSAVVIPKFRVGDVIRPKGSTKEYTIESISGGCYRGHLWRLPIGCDGDYELVEQKPAWGEEDEKYLTNAIMYICCTTHHSNIDRNEVIDWLKSLKERVGCEVDCTTEKGWSEEDENIINHLLAICAAAKRICAAAKRYRQFAGCSQDDVTKYQTWLKSLKPQTTWKPSEEQMDALANALSLANNCGEESAFDLRTLYEQLKKLK